MDNCKVEWKETFYDDGTLKKKVPYVNGKRHGTAEVYRGDGALAEEMPFVEDKAHGTAKFYDVKGALTMEIVYTNGKSERPAVDTMGIKELGRMVEGFASTILDQNSDAAIALQDSIKKSKQMDEDMEEEDQDSKETIRLDGWERVYRDDGTLKKETPYVNGKIHGTARTYWKNGMIKQEWSFIHDMFHGTMKHYCKDGTLYNEMIWIHNQSID